MLREKFSQSLKEALRAKDGESVSTLRLILAALKDRDIAARSKGNTEGVDDDEIMAMLQTMVKQRRESISMYEQGGRLELAEREQAEINVIERFLPKQFDESEIEEAVQTVVKDLSADSLKDMGRVMAELRERYAAQMDFTKASAFAKKLLSA